MRELFAPFHPGPLPPVPPQPVFQPPQQVALTGEASLFSVVGSLAFGAPSPAPATFEDLGVEEGLVAYRCRAHLPANTLLRLADLRDRAIVFLNGERVATLQRDGETQVELSNQDGPAELVILVESLGRINYGARVGERKGLLGGVLAAHRYLHGWSHAVVPLGDGQFPANDGDARPGSAGVGRAYLEVAEPADAWLAFPGGGRALVWLNGFLLGRYWDVGPQVTLYAPGPLWRPGRNEVRVLDLDGLPGSVEVRDEPELGPTEEFCGS